MTLLLMGSADELPAAPTQKTKFVEDVKEGETVVMTHPAGLRNLGNTCYMNATVQCLKNVPELQSALENKLGQLNHQSIMTNPSEAITIALRDMYKTLDKASDEGFPPFMFLQVLHSVFPQFAEKGEGGVFQQQDANECWTQIVRLLQQQLPGAPGKSYAGETTSFIDQYFGIQQKSTLKCVESEDEVETSSTERLFQISCFISQEVKFLHTGLKNRLTENITKASPTLNRDAIYKKTSTITRLPAYLTIQFVRFFYKEKERVNAKILKDVKFPMMLDVFDICDPELQEKIKPMRDKFKEREDKEAEAKAAMKKEESHKMDTDEKDKEVTYEPFSFEDDIGSNNSGYYELSAVLTHQGRTSSSGHYVAFKRFKDDLWLSYDDDKVSFVKTEDVLKLSGGGDWHSAYVLLYAPRKLVRE
jgi:ubiquitin carboxyl-terminal hydrolase 14